MVPVMPAAVQVTTEGAYLPLVLTSAKNNAQMELLIGDAPVSLWRTHSELVLNTLVHCLKDTSIGVYKHVLCLEHPLIVLRM